jgi:hypothetical protein
MAERKMVTTIRIDAETLYAARHALNLRGLSVAKFVTRKLEEVVHEYHTQQAPSGRPPATGTPSTS